MFYPGTNSRQELSELLHEFISLRIIVVEVRGYLLCKGLPAVGLSISSESVVTLAVGWEDGDFSGEPFWIFGLRHHEGDIEGISVSLRLPNALGLRQ